MKLLLSLENNFWIAFILSIILGLIFPFFGAFFNPFVFVLLMLMLFLAYLKVDIFDTFTHIKNPFFLFYILLLYLIISPAIVYLLFQFINPQLATAFLLLTAVPPGIAVPALTDIVKGNTLLAIVICFVGYIIAPFTIIFLFHFLTGKTIQIDIVGLFKTLLLISFVPLIVAQIARRFFIQVIEKTKKGYGGISILCMSFLGYTVIAVQANTILSHPFAIIVDLFWLYILFVFLLIVGYVTAFWRNKKDKTALSVAKGYMNNSLAIVLALAFFNPQVALIAVLSAIPWGTTLGIFKFALRYLR